MLAQQLIKFDQRMPDERYPPVATRQAGEYGGVEHKDTIDTLMPLQGMAQGGMVNKAQVAAEPHKGGIVVHGHDDAISGATLWAILRGMSVQYSTCPKCHHVRQPHETAEPERCPACGLYFAKWTTRTQFVPTAHRPTDEDEASDSGWRAELRSRLQHTPEHLDSTRLYGCAILLALIAFWGFRLYAMDYRDGEMGTSFMHNILLVIHEAGHMIFMPFGEFMTILGGSLFQLLLPLICAATLLWTNRDPFGAGLGVWWTGVSLLDLAPYIYDARAPQLVMLGGHTGEDGPHDWIYLLEAFGTVQHSQGYGSLAHTLGLLVMLLGLAWSAHTLWRWHRHLRP